VAADLDEREANRVVTSLGAEGVPAEKVAIAGGAGRFGVDVARGDAARAVRVLTESGLPRQEPAGVLEALGTSSIVPSRTAEHARWLQGVAGELERTLEEMNGVVSARVHLSAARRDPLSGEPPGEPGAAVLLKRRAGAPALGEGDVRRLVQGALPGLAEARIAVVQTEAPRTSSGADGDEGALVRVGPFSTPRHMAAGLRATLAVAAALNVVLVAALAALWFRARKRAVAGRP
jgi:type III secretion protein J